MKIAIHSLKYIDLSYCKLKEEHVKGICTGLQLGIPEKQSCSLECINFTGNIYMTERAFKLMFKQIFIYSANTYKKILVGQCDLADLQLTQGIQAGILQRETNKIVTSPVIEEVNLSCNYRLSIKALSDFFKLIFMQSSKTLKKISMQKCSLDETKISCIVSEIKKSIQ